jgi:hypothetical protein
MGDQATIRLASHDVARWLARLVFAFHDDEEIGPECWLESQSERASGRRTSEPPGSPSNNPITRRPFRWAPALCWA